MGYLLPQVSEFITGLQVGTTSIPIAVGLTDDVSAVGPEAKYEEMGKVFKQETPGYFSLLQNWVIGPIVMFILAVIFSHNYPE